MKKAYNSLEKKQVFVDDLLKENDQPKYCSTQWFEVNN